MKVEEKQVISYKIEFTAEEKKAMLLTAKILRELEKINCKFDITDYIKGFFDYDGCLITNINPNEAMLDDWAQVLEVFAEHKNS